MDESGEVDVRYKQARLSEILKQRGACDLQHRSI